MPSERLASSDPRLVVGLVGPMGVGKSTLLDVLREREFATLELSDVVKESLAESGILEPTRLEFRERAKRLRDEGHAAILAEKALTSATSGKNLGVSGIRHPAEIDFLRGQAGARVVVVGLVASFRERLRRIAGRVRAGDPITEDDIIAKLLADWRGDTDIPGTERLLQACDLVISTDADLAAVRERFAGLVENLLQSDHPPTTPRMDTPNERFQEIEKRATLTDAQRDALVARLQEAGAELTHESQLTDVYLCAKGVKDFSEIEMDQVGSYSFRVRRAIEGGQDGNADRSTVNVKVITTQGDHSAWDEHEFTVDSFEAALALFRSIGYKDYFTLRKKRWEYRWQDVGVFLEKIDNFGWAVELEVLAPASLADRMKQKLETMIGELGIQPDQYVTKSITNTMMRQHARF